MADPQRTNRNPSLTERGIDQPTVEFSGDSFKDSHGQENRAERETLASGRASESTVSQPKGKLGNYRIIDEVARGGMGVVYRVRQEGADRIVALKLIRGADPSSKEVERFQAEARAAAKLDHPGIVPIYDVDFIAGSPFFTMKYVDGPSLSARLSETPVEPRAAAQLIRDVADAIAHAHQSGIIHRDLKPGNILLEGGTHPMVTDFGLAKLGDAESELTRSGEAIGTPSYMPPEQAAGDRQRIDARSDIYSLGAVLYACLTGRPPFQAASAMATIIQVMRDEPIPPRSLNAEVPLDLEVICLKCLEKDPAKRFENASDVRDELTRYLSGQPILSRPASAVEKAWKWINRNRLAAAAMAASAVAVIGLSIALVVWSYSGRLAIELDRTQTAEATANRESQRANAALLVAEDAIQQKEQAEYYNQIALAQNAYQQDNIMGFAGLLFGSKPEYRYWEFYYLERLFLAPERAAPAEGPAFSAFLSADSNLCALAPSQNKVTFVDNETKRVLWSIPFEDASYKLQFISVSPKFDEMLSVEAKGNHAVASRVSYFRLAQDEQQFELVSSIETVSRVSIVADWTRRVAVLEADYRRTDRELLVVRWDNALQITPVPSPVRPMACGFSPDGQFLFVAGRDVAGDGGLLCKFETRSWDTTNQVEVEPRDEMHLSVSPGAGLVAVSAGRDLATYRADSLAIVDSAPPRESRILGLDFSPNGSQIAASTYSGRVDLLATDRLLLKRILKSQAWPSFKTLFSATDGSIATVCISGEIHRWKDSLSTQLSLLPVHSGKVKRIAVSPDDRLIASCAVVVSGSPAVAMTDLRTCKTQLVLADPNDLNQDHLANVRWLKFIDGGATLLTASYDYSLKFWNTQTGDLIKTMDLGDQFGLWDAALSDDERFLATVGLDGATRRFDLTSGEITHSYHRDSDGFWSVAMNQLGTEIYATGGYDDNLYVFSLNQFDKPEIYRNLTDAPRACTFIPSRNELLFGGISGHMSGVNLLSGKSKKPKYGETKLINAIAATPDGNRLVTCSDQGNVTIRETEHFEPIITLTGHHTAVTSATFSSSGQYLLTGDADGNLIIWSGD